MQNDINKFKEYANNIECLSGKHFNRNVIEKQFPKLYTKMKEENPDNTMEWLYRVLYDIKEIPKCIECDNKVNYRNFKVGYRKFCSPKCVNSFNSKDTSFSEKISKTMKNKFNETYYRTKYTYVKDKRDSDFLISGYCKHDDFYIDANMFFRRMENKIEICQKCIEERTLNELDYEIEEKDINFLSENLLKQHYPELWSKIMQIDLDVSFTEKKFMFFRNLENAPICPVCKENKCYFLPSIRSFSKTCNNVNCISSSSNSERQIFDLVNSYFPDAVSRYVIDKNEIDIFIPSLSFGIEFNGLYWHSEQYRDSKYHIDKTQFFKDKGIRLMNIWEDDWMYKNDICVSMIKNKLGVSTKIGARKCQLKEVAKERADIFLNDNHLQGKCNDSIRYGLFYDDELVSLMTFGKRRMIMNSTEAEGWELLRFCNVIGVSVTGGASKLFKFFVEQMKSTYVMSYANRDISDGNLYEKLKFEKVGKTTPGYWWCTKGRKYHRSNFMKHKIAITDEEKTLTENEIMKERGYYKVWNTGSLKYIWKN